MALGQTHRGRMIGSILAASVLRAMHHGHHIKVKVSREFISRLLQYNAAY